jgi:hypothetical protein
VVDLDPRWSAVSWVMAQTKLSPHTSEDPALRSRLRVHGSYAAAATVNWPSLGPMTLVSMHASPRPVPAGEAGSYPCRHARRTLDWRVKCVQALPAVVMPGFARDLSAGAGMMGDMNDRPDLGWNFAPPQIPDISEAIESIQEARAEEWARETATAEASLATSQGVAALVVAAQAAEARENTMLRWTIAGVVLAGIAAVASIAAIVVTVLVS